MNKKSRELKVISSSAWIKTIMVFSVLIFGLVIPYNLTIEVNYTPLFMAMAMSTIPIFFIFILVRNKLWKLSFDSKHKENYVKLLVWAFLFSSIFHTPFLLVNKIGAQKFIAEATVIKVADSFSRRDYIFPHLVLKIDDSIVKLRMSRHQLEAFVEDKKVLVSGTKGSLGYITKAHVK